MMSTVHMTPLAVRELLMRVACHLTRNTDDRDALDALTILDGATLRVGPLCPTERKP